MDIVVYTPHSNLKKTFHSEMLKQCKMYDTSEYLTEVKLPNIHSDA